MTAYRLNCVISLTFPEFRKTAFVRIPDAIEDDLPGLGSAEKDSAMIDHLSTFLDGLKKMLAAPCVNCKPPAQLASWRGCHVRH